MYYIIVLWVAQFTGKRPVGALFLGNFSPTVLKFLCQVTVKLKLWLVWE